MDRNQLEGHLAVLFTVLVWGTTFVSTKVLLFALSPLEIMIYRFSLGFLALSCVRRGTRTVAPGDEKWFALAGLAGITLYYLFENIALVYSTASNIGIIVVTAPLFTAFFARLFLKETLHPTFFLGFVLSMSGILVVSGQNTTDVHLFGDLLGIGAAVIWGVYSCAIRIIGERGYGTVQITRRTFGYGVLFLLPTSAFLTFEPSLEPLYDLVVTGNLLFLGLGASAVCFATWNFAVARIGAMKTSVYLYLMPLVTVLSAAIVLAEEITLTILGGMALTLAGVILSQYGSRKKTA